MKTVFCLIFALVAGMAASAQNYIAIAKDGNVYDEANAKYITVNQENEDVNVIPGMVFSTSQHTPGWYKVEYSPGLHAFVPEQITASNFNEPKAGTYQITNQPGNSLTVNLAGTEWSASANGKNYKGNRWEDILIFLDDNNNIAFSLVDLGNGPIAITYNNSVTKFF